MNGLPEMSPDERLALSRDHLRRAMAVPGTGGGVGLDALAAWWSRSPARLVSQVAAEAADRVVHPIAQRHPLRLVGGAFVVGGALAWSRPWRWLPRQALWAVLLPKLIKSLAAAQNPPR